MTIKCPYCKKEFGAEELPQCPWCKNLIKETKDDKGRIQFKTTLTIFEGSKQRSDEEVKT